MLITKFLTIAFATVAIATKSKAPTGPEVILADLQVIDDRTVILNQAIDKLDDKRFVKTALDIKHASDDVAKGLKQAIKDAKNLRQLNDDEAIQIGVRTFELNDVVISTLNNLQAQAPRFKARRLNNIARRDLEDQKQLTLDLTNAIDAKVPAGFKGAGAEIIKPVIDKFDEAIAAFR